MMGFKQRKFFGIDLEEYKIDRKIEEKTKEEEILVFGSTDGIYAFDGRKVKRIAKRPDCVRALAVRDGELYDGGDYKKIYRTRDEKEIAKRESWVRGLAVWKGELYDGGNYTEIYRTIDDEVVLEVKGLTYSMISVKGTRGGEILVFGSSGGVYAFDGKRVKRIGEKLYYVRALAVWKRKLYYGGWDGYYHFRIYKTMDEKEIVKRPDYIEALAVWDGELYDGGRCGKIYRTMDDKIVLDFEKPIYSMISVKRSVLRGLI